MNGDELLQKFLEFIQAEKPFRFYRDYHVPTRPHCYIEWYRTYNKRVFLDPHDYHTYFESDCEPCTLRNPAPTVKAEYITEGCYGAYDAVLFMSINGKIYDVIPIEAKGNTDILDDRLREQIWMAIKNYGQSLLLLDNEQAYKIKKHLLHKCLPCEIWFFNGQTFEQMTKQIERYNSDGILKISKRAIEKATGIHDYGKLRVLQSKMSDLQSLIHGLAYNQWNWKSERKFTPEEQQIFYELIGDPLPNRRRSVEQVTEKTVKLTKTLIVKETVQKSLFEKQVGLRNSKEATN
jgi:hypothetical protein